MEVAKMGDYEVVSHVETPECSLRLLRLGRAQSVQLHYHERTTQIYFVLEGVVQAIVGTSSRALEPHQSLRIPPRTPHRISSEETALVLSISIPPLHAEDQHPLHEPRTSR
jgi:mannose-6-phosphate isomerase-like protein (cupin superfamily)